MWWKLYFWILAILLVIGTFSRDVNTAFNVIDWIGLILSIPSIVGLFVFAYKKPFLTNQIWKIVFWLTIILDAYFLFYASTPVKDIVPNFLRPSATSSNIIEILITLAFELPILYALYQVAFNPQWYLKGSDKNVDREKKQFSMVSSVRTIWWKAGAVLIGSYGFINLIALAGDFISLADTSTSKISVAVINLILIIIGILLWYRVNLALWFAILFFIFRAVALLAMGFYGEFLVNTVVLVVLFILILKTQTNLTAQRKT